MMLILIKLLAVLSVAELLLYYTHMYQLNSYMALRQMRWLRRSLPSGLFARIALPLICAVMLLLPFGKSLAVQIISAVLICVQLIIFFPIKAKKPLVFTKRVIRLLISEAVVCAIFTAVISLIAEGASATLFAAVASFFIVTAAGFINLPIEKAIQQSFINKAKAKLAQMPSLTVIGITGSYGKTGVKHYLTSILSAKYNVLMTPGSYNTTMGVVRTINELLSPAHDIFICEMGAKARGQIKEICDIVKPKYGIITSIGPQHLENFKTIENIIDTKFELCDALPSDGICFLNFDNQYIRERAEKYSGVKKIVRYGTADENVCDFYSDVVSLSAGGTEFTLHSPDKSVLTLFTRLAGRHNVVNITGCAAAAYTLGLSGNEIALPIMRLECAPHRLQISAMGGGTTLIDDAFNANPDGVRAALEVLSGFPDTAKKIMITPGMIELGSVEHAENFTFGKEAAEVCDRVYLVGDSVTGSIREGLLEAGFPEESIVKVQTFTEAFGLARQCFTGSEKVILIENDFPDNYR